MMNRKAVAGVAILGVSVMASVYMPSFHQPKAEAHCQVPCGIYDDAARIQRMHEDAQTIAKAIRNINDLSGKKDATSVNQATRWIVTKEQHASHIIQVVSEYFLTQKVKPVDPDDKGYKDYLTKLADHHAVMVAAMKTKQDPSDATAKKLDMAITKLGKHYGVMKGEGHAHGHGHGDATTKPSR